MSRNFLVIAITLPEFFPSESFIINGLLSRKEVDYVHIRKPGVSIEKMEGLITEIDPIFYSRIKVHDCFDLVERFHLGGCHLNSRNPSPPDTVRSISRSIHSLAEIDKNLDLDYQFLSPVFDSISKPGYKASFELEKISSYINGKNVIALGGVTPGKFRYLKNLGFKGAALSGYFFQR